MQSIEDQVLNLSDNEILKLSLNGALSWSNYVDERDPDSVKTISKSENTPRILLWTYSIPDCKNVKFISDGLGNLIDYGTGLSANVDKNGILMSANISNFEGRDTANIKLFVLSGGKRGQISPVAEIDKKFSRNESAGFANYKRIVEVLVSSDDLEEAYSKEFQNMDTEFGSAVLSAINVAKFEEDKQAAIEQVNSKLSKN